MAFPDLFIFDEAQASAESSPGYVFNTTRGSTGDYSNSRIAIQGSGWGEFDISSLSYTSGWIHFWTFLDVSGEGELFVLKGPTSDLLRIYMINTSEHWRIERWNGSTWIQMGSDVTTEYKNPIFDIYFNLNNVSGEFSVYADGALIGQFLGDTISTADTTVATLRFASPGGSTTADCNFGPIVVDSVDTRTLVIEESIPVSNGGMTEWTGSEPDIDEQVGAPTDSNLITSTTAGQRETYNHAVINPAISPVSIDGVKYVIRAQAVTDPGLYIKALMRKGGVNYLPGASVQPIAGTFNNYVLDIPLNPETETAFASVAEADAFEYGMESSSTP